MITYRIKQFLWAITARFKPIDTQLLDTYLNSKEQKIFNRLKVSEKQHSIRVCKDALKKYEHIDYIDRNKLAKIALLHDVGKSKGNLNLIDKSIIVILDKISKGALRKFESNKKINLYYNHPKKSVDLLNSIDEYDNEFLQAIEQHHYGNKNENIYLNIIRECDDKN